MEYRIRLIQQDEIGLLKDFLYHAIYIPKGAFPPPREIINEEALQVYIKEFGTKPDDHCFVAEVGGKVVGAVWVRIMEDYGHIDDETPSFAISLEPAYRHQGIGSSLMKTMLSHLAQCGYQAASLSVQKENYAARMYQTLGFEIIAEHEEEYIMKYRF